MTTAQASCKGLCQALNRPSTIQTPAIHVHLNQTLHLLAEHAHVRCFRAGVDLEQLVIKFAEATQLLVNRMLKVLQNLLVRTSTDEDKGESKGQAEGSEDQMLEARVVGLGLRHLTAHSIGQSSCSRHTPNDFVILMGTCFHAAQVEILQKLPKISSLAKRRC